MSRLWLTALVLVCLSPRALFGCECGPKDFQAAPHVKFAAVVFIGTVVFTDDDGSGTFRQKTLVRFQVEEAFKGLNGEVREVWVDPGSFTTCYALYQPGEKWLIYGYGGGTIFPPDTAAMSVDQRQGQSKPLPPGIDANHPPVIYSAPECAGSLPIGGRYDDVVAQNLRYLRKYKAKMLKKAANGVKP